MEPELLGGAGPLRQRGFAWAMARFGKKAERYLAEHKSRLFGDLSGAVLEIGPGTGANLAYLGKNVRWTGVEPNPYMFPHLRREAARLGFEADLREGTAERL